jgi:hypothetical protein
VRLTWEKFDKLYTDLLTYCMVDDERLRLETLEAGHVGCLKHMKVAGRRCTTRCTVMYLFCAGIMA